MAIFKELTARDFLVDPTTSNQLVDVLQTDIATDEKRKRYQNWYSVSTVKDTDPEDSEFPDELRQVFSGLFQTVHDIDHQFQTANPLVDMTFGINGSYDDDDDEGAKEYVVGKLEEYSEGFDESGKALFKDGTLMVREKLDIYSQMCQQLLGDRPPRVQFYRKLDDTDEQFRIDYALFLSCKRLFSRDGIRRGTFALRLNKSLFRKIDSGDLGGENVFSIQPEFPYWKVAYTPGLEVSETEIIITDATTSSQNLTLFGGSVGQLTIQGDPGNTGFAGLIFYDAGLVVLDCKTIFSLEQKVCGIVSSIVSNGLTYDDDTTGVDGLGDLKGADVDLAIINGDPSSTVNFLPINKRIFGADSTGTKTLEDFFYAGTIDDIIDHLATTRFTNGIDSGLSSFTFQNKTKIKSMLVFIDVSPGEFNYSNNPTYTTSGGQIRARDESGVRPFSYITKIGLYDADNNLLAVASLSRPVANTPGTRQLFRIRLDF
jgi:hypothetical protein